MRELLGRHERRLDALALRVALGRIPGLELRIRVLFVHLAERWGEPTASGWRLTIPLTHRLPAELCGCSRPAVTTALARLRHEGTLRFDETAHEWFVVQTGRDELVVSHGRVPCHVGLAPGRPVVAAARALSPRQNADPNRT